VDIQPWEIQKDLLKEILTLPPSLSQHLPAPPLVGIGVGRQREGGRVRGVY